MAKLSRIIVPNPLQIAFSVSFLMAWNITKVHKNAYLFGTFENFSYLCSVFRINSGN